MSTNLILTTRETTLLMAALTVFEKDRIAESDKAEAARDGVSAERFSGTALELRDLYSKVSQASDAAMIARPVRAAA